MWAKAVEKTSGAPSTGEGDGGVEEAGNVIGLSRAEGWGNGGLDGGEADDDDGLGIVEGGCGVQAEVEGLVFGRCEGGNVLVLGGVEGGEDAGEIDNGADVGGIVAGPGKLGVGSLVDEVGAAAVGKCGEEGNAVTVVRAGSGCRTE